MLGFGSVHAALCASLSVYLCESLCEARCFGWASRDGLAVEMGKGRWEVVQLSRSCRGCRNQMVVTVDVRSGPRMVDGSENAGLLSGGDVIKKGGATDPRHSQYQAMRDCPQYCTRHFPDSRLCGLVGAVVDPPRVTEGVADR